MDFQFELGKTLDGTLRLFAKKNLCAENIISRRSVTREVAKKTLFALYNRGCIANLERKTYESAEKIELADRFERRQNFERLQGNMATVNIAVTNETAAGTIRFANTPSFSTSRINHSAISSPRLLAGCGNFFTSTPPEL